MDVTNTKTTEREENNNFTDRQDTENENVNETLSKVIDIQNCDDVDNCVDIMQARNFEVVKAHLVGKRVLLSAHSKVTKTMTVRNRRVELVEGSKPDDYFIVFQKINKKDGAKEDYFVVCFTKRIEGKRYCISPDIRCFQDQPDRIDLMLHELPVSWDGTAEHIPKDQYKYWFKYTSKLSNGDESIFQSFYSDGYYLRVSDSVDSIYLERQVHEGRLSDHYKFNYYSKCKNNLKKSGCFCVIM
ncbi:hypothetical protein SNE40_002413 [Patella caerulea]|uniref:Uncharacterized protein n=1 Tax=Patella caerulea TaxID=87958 RepID=A0AAN8PZ56_PATCE